MSKLPYQEITNLELTSLVLSATSSMTHATPWPHWRARIMSPSRSMLRPGRSRRAAPAPIHAEEVAEPAHGSAQGEQNPPETMLSPLSISVKIRGSGRWIGKKLAEGARWTTTWAFRSKKRKVGVAGPFDCPASSQPAALRLPAPARFASTCGWSEASAWWRSEKML